MQGLTGIRVVEVGDMVAAPYAAKLLADLGAEVIKVEPPAGDTSRQRGPFPKGIGSDPEQSGLFLGLNTNKTSCVLDLQNSAGRAELHELLATADIVIHSLSASNATAAGLGGADLLAAHPSLVVAAITPFGHTGPQAEWQAEEINIVHGGGWGYLIPGDAEDLDLPPLTVFGHPASCQAGMAAALAIVAAWDKADRTGVGEFIDMSSMAHVSSMLESSFVAWSYMGEIANRTGGRILTPWKILPCADGLIFVVTVEQDQWERLVEMMGNPAWAQMEVFADIASRAANQDMLYVYLEEWTRQHSVEELFHAGQANRVCFAPVFTMGALARQEHLAERGFFHEVAGSDGDQRTHLGAPWVGTPNLWNLRSPAPKLGEGAAAFAPRPGADRDTASEKGEVGDHTSLPLAGTRIVDFSWVWAGPFCTMHLAYLGAEVIKIESSTRPGLGRRLPIHPPELEVTLNTCGYFNQWDQGKKSVEIDLSTPEGLAQALQLVATADVVVDNYATGVMDRLGLSDEVLRATNPELIIASVTGYGHTGPLRKYMGYGPTTAPLSGLTAVTGHVGGRPEEAGLSFGDPAAGLACAYAIGAALVHRRRSGEPSRIDTSLWEATAVNAIDAWMSHALGNELTAPQGNRSLTQAPHGVFRAAGDDQWVSIACTSDAQWRVLAELLGGDVATDDRFATATERKANEDALEELVTALTTTLDKWAVTNLLQGIGVAAYPSLTVAEVEQNPQLIARDFWVRFDHPVVGQRAHSGVPWLTTNTPTTVPSRAPLLGEHSAEYLL